MNRKLIDALDEAHRLIARLTEEHAQRVAEIERLCTEIERVVEAFRQLQAHLERFDGLMARILEPSTDEGGA